MALFLFCLVRAPLALAGEPRTFALSLADAEQLALRSSYRLEAAAWDEHAAKKQADAQFTTLLPQLTLDANYRYQSVVPALTFPAPLPGQPPTSFVLGANSSYSIGPTLSYTVWNGMASRLNYQSSERQLGARAADRENARLQTLASARTAYVRVQLALEELRLIAETLKTSEVQHDDILKRFRAGASSRLDELSSRREVLTYRLQFKQRQADLSGAIEELLDITRQQDAIPVPDASSPYDAEILRIGATEVPPPTLILRLDSLGEALQRFTGRAWEPPTPSHPELRARELGVQATELNARSIAAGLWPAIQVSARSSLDYPNGPVIEQINQNSVAVSLTMPLFDWGRTLSLAGQRRAEAESQQSLRDQSERDLTRDWRQAMEQLAALRAQESISREAVAEAAEEARLMYETYRFGRVSLVDVQNSTLRALNAKVQSARIAAQTLLQMIQLASLSGKDE